MRDKDSFIGLINSAIDFRMKYIIPREGQVKDIDDPEKKGRILVIIPAFGWDSNDKGAWCNPIDKNLLSGLKLNDWVIIQFVDGNPNFPILLGKSNRIKDQIPKNYDGKSTTHILFESPNNKIMERYDEKEDLLQIGKKDFRSSARIDDTIISDSSTDSEFWTMWSAFFGIITGASIPEPGNGAPSALQTALATAIASAGGTPSEINGKINSGSSQVEVGDK